MTNVAEQKVENEAKRQATVDKMLENPSGASRTGIYDDNVINNVVSKTTENALTTLFVEQLDVIETKSFHRGIRFGLLLNNVVLLFIYLVVHNMWR